MDGELHEGRQYVKRGAHNKFKEWIHEQMNVDNDSETLRMILPTKRNNRFWEAEGKELTLKKR